MSQAGSTFPLLKHGERMSQALAEEVHERATRHLDPVFIRTSGDWNNASTMKARMESSKTFAPYAEDLVWFCQRIGPETIGLYVRRRDG